MHRRSVIISWIISLTFFLSFVQGAEAGICVFEIRGQPDCADGQYVDEDYCANKCRAREYLGKVYYDGSKGCQFRSQGTCAEFNRQLKDFQETQKKINEEADQSYNAAFPDVAALNQLGAGTTPQELAGRVIAIGMGIIGTIALVILIYAGLLWMTAHGNADREKRSRDIMIWGALGVIVILSSYAIVKFILDNAVR